MSAPPAAALPRQKSRAGIAYYASRAPRRDSPIVLFIHGVGLSADCWQQQITALQSDYTICAIDLPGHGNSAPIVEKYPKIDAFADKIADFVSNELKAAVILIGHSLGALIALELAACRLPQLHAIAAVSAVYRRSAAEKQAVQARAARLMQGEAREALIDDTLRRWFGAPAQPPEAAALCRRLLLQTPPAAYAAAYHAFSRHDAAASALNAISQPVLYLTGGDDPNSTAAMSRQMAQATANAKAVVVDGHAHMLQMTAAEKVNAVLVEWLHDNAAC